MNEAGKQSIEWREARLGEVLPLKYGKARSEQFGYPRPETSAFGSNGAFATFSRALTQGPSILVGRKGAAGTIHYSTEPCWPIDTTYYTEGNDATFLPFFRYLLESLRLVQFDRSTAIPSLSRDDYDSKIIRFPEAIDEQRRIVAEIEKQFTRLEVGVAALRRVQSNLKRYRASVLKAACEGRLVPTEAELSQNGIGKATFETGDTLLARILTERRQRWQGRGRFKEPPAPDIANLGILPVGWSWVNVNQLGDVQLGRQRSPKNVSKNYPTKYIRAANITERGLDVVDVLEMEFSPAERERFALQEGDIVLSEASGSPSQVGKPAVWRNELPLCCFQNTVLRLRPVVAESKYVLLVLQHYYLNSVFAKVAGGIGINHLGAGKFSAIPFPLPPLAEQSRIVAEVERRLSVVEESEAVVADNLQRATRLRQSILHTAFTERLILQHPGAASTKTNPDSDRQKLFNSKILNTGDLIIKTNRSRHSFESSTMKRTLQSEINPQNVTREKFRGISKMKLLTLQLFDDFKSLRASNYEFRSQDEMSSSLSPICLVGLNGSGKSNLIEVLSEVLCGTELALLPWKAISKKRRVLKIRFVLEYELQHQRNTRPIRVRIENTDIRTGPIFSVIEKGHTTLIKDHSECLRLLPTRIVSYSSGLNETISTPYFRTSTLYSEEVLKQAYLESSNYTLLTRVNNSRTLFLDYESNALILVTNFLFQQKTKLKLFNEILRIKDLASFDIRFRPIYQGNKSVKLTKELEKYIICFRKAADEVVRDERGGEIFRYYDAQISRFKLREHFEDGLTFFSAIYKLSLLNMLALKGRERKFFLRDYAQDGQLERPPSVAREDHIFAIENIRVQLSKPNKIIDYAAISDGEHQFLQIFGTTMLFKEPGSLFLFDEPETHFNPQWRRRFVQHLDDMRDSDKQEFLISTHSPFIVSGCHGDHVFKFERKGDDAICNKVSFETFGASYDFLLARLFDLKIMISEQAVNEMRELLKTTSIKRLQNSLDIFGESFEKRFIYERIAKIKALQKTRKS